MKNRGSGWIRDHKWGICAVSLSAALFLTILVSAGMGYMRIAGMDVLRIILSGIFGSHDVFQVANDIFPTVVMDVRLPRILTAAIVGGGLAVSGVVFQGILLNPLADPYTLGVSAGAAFGASIAILVNIFLSVKAPVALFAFLGAAGTLFAVIFLSASGGGWSSDSLILSGIIVAAILSAGISFLKYIAEEQVAVIIFWLMGSFAGKEWTDVLVTLGFVTAGTGVFLFYARDLNLLSLGHRSASSLGVDVKKTPLILLITASLVSAVCVSVSGIIGFVGLLVPHMMRSITGPDNMKLLPVSFLAGSILLLWADTITRAVLPAEVPIGVLTALIGGPFFCYIFTKKRKHSGSRGF